MEVHAAHSHRAHLGIEYVAIDLEGGCISAGFHSKMRDFYVCQESNYGRLYHDWVQSSRLIDMEYGT
jgi:hypothetical protein